MVWAAGAASTHIYANPWCERVGGTAYPRALSLKAQLVLPKVRTSSIQRNTAKANKDRLGCARITQMIWFYCMGSYV